MTFVHLWQDQKCKNVYKIPEVYDIWRVFCLDSISLVVLNMNLRVFVYLYLVMRLRAYKYLLLYLTGKLGFTCKLNLIN